MTQIEHTTIEIDSPLQIEELKNRLREMEQDNWSFVQYIYTKGPGAPVDCLVFKRELEEPKYTSAILLRKLLQEHNTMHVRLPCMTDTGEEGEILDVQGTIEKIGTKKFEILFSGSLTKVDRDGLPSGTKKIPDYRQSIPWSRVKSVYTDSKGICIDIISPPMCKLGEFIGADVVS